MQRGHVSALATQNGALEVLGGFAVRTLLIAAAAVSLSSPVLAQTAAPSSTCKALALSVDAYRKDLSVKEYTSFARSAPQASQLAAEIANILTMMKMNLDLMGAHRCPMPTEPVATATYMVPAMECATAGLKDEPDKEAKCDRSKWKSLNQTVADLTPKPAAAGAK